MPLEPGVGGWADPETHGHTHGSSFQLRKFGSPISPGPAGQEAAGPGNKHTLALERGPGRGAAWRCSEAGVAPGPGLHKALSSHGLKKGRTRTVHSRPVHGARGGRWGLSPCIPTPRVSSLGCLPGAEALAASTGERHPQDTMKDLDAGPHLPAGQRPAKPADTEARPGSPRAVLHWPCDLASSSVSSEPCAWGVRCRAPGTHLLGMSTTPEPPGAPAATPQHLGAQTGPRPASAAPREVVAGPPSQPASTPGRPRPAWVLGRGSHSTGSASQEPRGSPGGTQPHGAGCNTDPTHLPL